MALTLSVGAFISRSGRGEAADAVDGEGWDESNVAIRHIQEDSGRAHLVVQHQVEDFAKWKGVFDSVIELRRSNGEVSAQVLQTDGDENSILAIFEWESLEKARAYAASPELKEAMARAGVVGRPEITFMNAAAGA